MTTEKRFSKTQTIAWLGVLLAFVVFFQVFGSYIKIGTTSFSFVLVPIVLGGLLLGPIGGLFLGLAFSIVVTIMGLAGADGFTNILLANRPFGTLVTIFLKGILSGLIPALVFKLFKKNKLVGTFVCSIIAPIINTGIFIVCMLFMSDVLVANFVADGTTVIYFLVIICAGVNFLVELALNIVLAPAIYRLTQAIRKIR